MLLSFVRLPGSRLQAPLTSPILQRWWPHFCQGVCSGRVTVSSNTDPSPVDRMLADLRNGDARAAEEIFSRFSGQLSRLVQSKIGWSYRRKFDPEDVAQSVFKSFIRIQADESLAFENWDALWGLLSLIAIRKCGHRIDYLRAACRDVTREHSVMLDREALEQSGHDLQALSREPTPSHAAMLSETLDRLLEPLDERDREITRLALQGYSTAEIATQVARSQRTVQRVLDRIRKHLEQAAEVVT